MQLRRAGWQPPRARPHEGRGGVGVIGRRLGRGSAPERYVSPKRTCLIEDFPTKGVSGSMEEVYIKEKLFFHFYG